MLSNICAGTPQQIQHVFNLRLLTLVLQLQHNASINIIILYACMIGIFEKQ